MPRKPTRTSQGSPLSTFYDMFALVVGNDPIPCHDVDVLRAIIRAMLSNLDQTALHQAEHAREVLLVLAAEDLRQKLGSPPILQQSDFLTDVLMPVLSYIKRKPELLGSPPELEIKLLEVLVQKLKTKPHLVGDYPERQALRPAAERLNYMLKMLEQSVLPKRQQASLLKIKHRRVALWQKDMLIGYLRDHTYPKDPPYRNDYLTQRETWLDEHLPHVHQFLQIRHRCCPYAESFSGLDRQYVTNECTTEGTLIIALLAHLHHVSDERMKAILKVPRPQPRKSSPRLSRRKSRR